MKSVSEKDKRPNCLIIDEIDGAPAPTVQVLNITPSASHLFFEFIYEVQKTVW